VGEVGGLGAGVRGQVRGGDVRRPVEVGGDHARFDQRGADAEGLGFVGVGLEEAFDGPLAGVVERHRGEGQVAAHAGGLQEVAAALGAQVRGDRAGEVDGGGDVGVDLAGDLPVGEFLGQADEAVTGVGDDHVDTAQLGERGVDDLAQACGVGDVELLAPQPSDRQRLSMSPRVTRGGEPGVRNPG
jgi:hypothetical protein